MDSFIIGTLGEKTLHSVLKHYFEPDTSCHEKPAGNFVVDILRNKEIIEIQTRSLNALRPKLNALLSSYKITVIYPIAKVKWLLWIDENNTVTKKRKSPKVGRIYDAIHEIYSLKQFLRNDNFCLCLIFSEIEEYRFLDGWSKDKKKGSTRHNRVPVEVLETIYLKNESDYVKFIPEALPERFTSVDFKNTAQINMKTSQRTINILNYMGVIKFVGKQGQLRLYERSCII